MRAACSSSAAGHSSLILPPTAPSPPRTKRRLVTSKRSPFSRRRSLRNRWRLRMATNSLALAQALGAQRHEECQSLTLSEERAAAYVGVGVSLFQQEVRRHVPPIPIGKRRIVFARKALDRFVERRMEEEACHAR